MSISLISLALCVQAFAAGPGELQVKAVKPGAAARASISVSAWTTLPVRGSSG